MSKGSRLLSWGPFSALPDNILFTPEDRTLLLIKSFFFSVIGLPHHVILLVRWSASSLLPLEIWRLGNCFMHHYHKKLEVHQTQHAVGGADLKCENTSICAPSAQLWGRPRITSSPLFFPLLIWASERKHESKFIKQHCMNSASFADTCSSHLS